MRPPRSLRAISLYDWYRWALVAALALYALLALRLAAVVPFAWHAQMNYGGPRVPTAVWIAVMAAIAVGCLLLAVLVWRDREVIDRVRWWVLVPGLVLWIAAGVVLGFGAPTDVAYPNARILFTAAVGIVTLPLLTYAAGRIPAPPVDAAEHDEPVSRTDHSWEASPLRGVAFGTAAVVAALALWGWGGPNLRVDADDAEDLEFVGDYSPVANTCLLTDLRPLLDELEMEPRISDRNSPEPSDIESGGQFWSECEVLPEEWATDFNVAAADMGEFSMSAHPGMYLIGLVVQTHEENVWDDSLDEGCDRAELDDGAEYWICREDDFGEDMGVYSVEYFAGNAMVQCRFGAHEVPDRNGVIEALESVCLEAFETVHADFRR